MKKQKQILSKIMKIGGAKSNAFLQVTAAKILDEIRTLVSNEEIIERLDVLEEFVYKVPEQTLAVVEHLIQNPHPAQDNKTSIGTIPGKSSDDVAMKALDLLDNIRYIHLDAILPFLTDLTTNSNEGLRNRALDIIKKISEYNYNIFKANLGYVPQRKVLDFILRWSGDEQSERIEFVKTATKEILGSSVEGSSVESPDTLTMHFGSVPVTDFLKKMRRETIDLLIGLYDSTSDAKLQIELIKILAEATRTPMKASYDNDLVEMIKEDADYLFDIYRDIIFDSDGQMTNNLAVVEDIDSTLFWLYRNEQNRSDKLTKLREDIHADEFYSLFHKLVGDDIILREEDGWDKHDAKHQENVGAMISDITAETFEKWLELFNCIAEQFGLVPDWHFHSFGAALGQLAKEKPQLGFDYLRHSIEKDMPLKQFSGSLLMGLRNSGELELWDRATAIIAKLGEEQLVRHIVNSLNLPREADSKKDIRTKDIELLEQICNATGLFAFLSVAKDLNLEYAKMSTLTRLFALDPKRIEPLILGILKKNTEWAHFQVKEIQFAIWNKDLDRSEFSRDALKYLTSWLVDLNNLDWDAQQVLRWLSEDDLSVVFDVMIRRIEQEVKRKESRKDAFRSRDMFDAIPYHFNPELVKFITEHKDFIKYASDAIKNVDPKKWSIFNWNISSFLNALGNPFRLILERMIESGKPDDVARAVELMGRFEYPDIDLCVKAVEKTDDKHVLDKIRATLGGTGIVSGEYGLAEAYEKKAEALSKYVKHKDSRVAKFIRDAIKHFSDQAKLERKRADEERAIRKIEFEG